MGRADDKEGEALLSEADDEKDKDYSDKDATDVDDVDVECKKKYKCTEPGCTARFLRPSRLTWHLRKHNDERPYKCSIEGCTRAYTNSSHLKRHENSHKPVTTTYTCNECLLEVGSLFSLKRHRKMIHDPKRLTCAECGAKFRKKHCYNEHLSMHAGISMYKCETCQQDFPTLRLMKKHQLVHDKRKTYPCKSPGCNQVFEKWSKLRKHMATEHQFVHKCDKCDKTFKWKCLLKYHSAYHDNDNIFLPCPHKNCPKFYAHQRNLNEHEDVFHEGKRYFCNTCNAALTSKASLIRHIKVSHEFRKEEPKKSKKSRKPRKDIGVSKKSAAVKLSGLNVPYRINKKVLNRKPEIDLKMNEEGRMSSENIEEEKKTSEKSSKEKDDDELLKKDLEKESTVGFDRVTQSFVPLVERSGRDLTLISDDESLNEKKNLEKPVCIPEQTEEEILLSAGSLLHSGKLLVLENGEVESSDVEEKNEEILLLAERLLDNDSDMNSETFLEEYSNVPDVSEDNRSLPESDFEQEQAPNTLGKCFAKFSDSKNPADDLQIVLEKSSDHIAEMNMEL